MARASGRGASGYDREAAEVARQATLERMHTQLAEKVGSLASMEAWGSWLRFASGFHRYSFNNTLLIWAQKPEATMVAGYRAWQAKGRQVRRGETAIRVYGPITKREPKLDPQGRPVRGADGQPVQELRIVGVKPVSVFDVSQTDGDPLPEPPQAKLLTGEAPPGLWDGLQAFVEAQGFTVSRGDCGGANGVTDFDARQVRVRADIDDAASVRTLAHEAGHVVLHQPGQRQPFGGRGVMEVEAESVAFLVTAAHGLDASQYTFNYVAGWAQQASSPEGASVEDVIKATGQRVITATDRILQAVRDLPKVCEHIEVPIQAGDDEVLERMRRGYTRAEYLDLIDRIRAIVPDVAINTDIIVGFCGETAEQFERTYAVIEECAFDKVHLARYSPRPGTVSERRMLDDVPEDEKVRRHKRLEELQERISAANNARFLGEVVEVLIEDQHKGKWRGRNRQNKLVFIESDLPLRGRLVEAQVTWTGPWSMQARFVRDVSPLPDKVAAPFHTISLVA